MLLSLALTDSVSDSGMIMRTRHYDIDDYRYIHRPMD